MTIFDEIRAYLAKTCVTQAELSWAIAGERSFITKLINNQLLVTEERAKLVRDWICKNPEFPADALPNAPADRPATGISSSSDLWMKDAKLGSAMLIERLRLKHPERCGA